MALVINQYAMPRTQWGLTRNADLFSRLSGWGARILSGSRDHYSQQVFSTTDPLFDLLFVPPYRGNGFGRMFGWGVFAAEAAAKGLFTKDLAVVYGSSPHLLAPVAGYAVSRLRRVPLVLEVRDLWPESIVASGNLERGSRVHKVLVGLERALYRASDEVVVVTSGWEDHFRSLGVPDEKVTVINNGTDVEAFATDEPREELRRRFGVSGVTAVYAGAHGEANGLDQVLDAARALPDANFILIGAGTQKAALVARAGSEGISNVEFRDPIPKSELGGLLAACDIGIHVLAPWDLLSSGLSPNKLFDYMAAGLPVVSNCGEGLRDVVKDGECGRIGGWGELTQCISDVAAAAPEQRSAWGRAGREIVRSRYSREAAAAKLGRVLDRAIARRRRRS